MTLSYPAAPRQTVVDTHHGFDVEDPYRWLEDADAPATREWIVAQNELTEAYLAKVAARSDIHDRLRELTDHPRSGAPWRRGDRWFVLRNMGLQNQDVLWTMPAPDAEGEVLLDPNLLSADGTVALTGLTITEDGSLVCYATSSAGSDWLEWRVRDVETGQELGDLVRWSKFSFAAWAPDASGFYYARFDEPAEGEAFEQVNREHQVFFHRLGTPQESDRLVYARPDEPEWGFWVQTSTDERYLILEVTWGTRTENRIMVLDLVDPKAEVTELIDEFDASYAFIGNVGSTLYLRTDLDAPLGRVIAVDVDRPQRAHWREVVAEGDDTLERVHLVGGRLLGVYLHHAAHRLRWFTLDGAADGELELPGLGAVESLTGRYDDRVCCYTFTSFTEPTAVFRHDIDAGTTDVLHRADLGMQVPLVTEQHFVRSSDGTDVPMFLVHRADVSADGTAAAWLYGYGGFSIPITPVCKTEWLVWLERGGVLAVANLRGGGEYGKPWHDAGRLANKQQVFDDAIAAAEWLQAEGWAAEGKVAIHGRSNGGLLAAACLTQRPDLFGAAVPEVGVLDMLRFEAFTIGWAWTSDYGSVADEDQFRTLLAYSPLHRIADGTKYPPTLVTTGDHDDRVVPGHSFKFAAALQAAQGGDAPILIRVETSAGHGVGKPTDKLIEERADVVAFLTAVLGASGPQ